MEEARRQVLAPSYMLSSSTYTVRHAPALHASILIYPASSHGAFPFFVRYAAVLFQVSYLPHATGTR